MPELDSKDLKSLVWKFASSSSQSAISKIQQKTLNKLPIQDCAIRESIHLKVAESGRREFLVCVTVFESGFHFGKSWNILNMVLNNTQRVSGLWYTHRTRMLYELCPSLLTLSSAIVFRSLLLPSSSHLVSPGLLDSLSKNSSAALPVTLKFSAFKQQKIFNQKPGELPDVRLS